ncbi:MAG: PSD1 and planctomycete cytochrome C domain-containing protein [Pirellulaceae bacterium]|nr:PSD1 and planctomycete cytochrome C domain-containing protein [Pirellulaceae bacterium]
MSTPIFPTRVNRLFGRRGLLHSINRWTVILLLGLPSITSHGQSSNEQPQPLNDPSHSPIDYLQDVRPILRTKCATCHSEVDPGGGLRLDSAEGIRQGGDSGPAIVRGNSAESRLIHAVLQNGDLLMPPPDEAKPLEASQIEILRRWIDQGAIAPEDESQVSHWAFQKPTRPPLPVVVPAGGSANANSPSSVSDLHPIDAFISQRLQQHNLQALPLAPQHIQLRRVFLDLIGLPPTPEQVHAFLNDDSPNAWEKVVDQLLSSPQYGERWGRHWMDVWRYSDWDGHGAEVRESKPHIWRWRDWIIESLNEDKPYDRMIMEMLAADEFKPGDPQALRATGYLVRNWYLFNRNTWLDNTIEHTGKAFLGVTFNCARCHDHMYDPVSQAEYYQLRAFFEPHDVRTDQVPGQGDVTIDGLVRVYDANAAAQTQLFVRGDEKNPLPDRFFTPQVPVALGPGELKIEPVELPAADYYPGLQSHIAAKVLRDAEAEEQTSTAALAAATQAVANAKANLLSYRQSTTESAPPLFLKDDFTAARPDVWVARAGNWQYQNGHLQQLDPVDTMCSFETLQPHSPDFTAKLKFITTGGEVYQSVGIAFDVIDNQNFSFVYASAGGSKIQVAHRVNGADQYPPAGAKEIAIELNRVHDLLVTVRGTQVDVALNCQAVLNYALPMARPGQGRFQIWTYDAIAEFLALEISNTAVLSEASLLAAVQQAESAAKLTEKTQLIALTALDFTRSRIAADQANYSQPPAANAKGLSLAAGLAERSLALHQEELKLLTAEQTLQNAVAALPMAEAPVDEAKQKAVTDAGAVVAAAKSAVETAQKALAEPFEAYTRLAPLYPTTSTGRRLALAQWITSRDNPLSARVAINHIWLRHFHSPLVPTMFDFGMNGQPPIHPELLDWLACELMENDWKMKPLHRLMVTSEAYRRASSPTADQHDVASINVSVDPDNLQLWRQNSYRMEAEVVRDAMFHVAGKLDTTLFGPDLDPNAGLTQGRRSIYFRNSKEKKMTFLSTFDSPNPVECYRRAESISPQQSLAMSNSPLTLSQSRVVAANIREQMAAAPSDDSNQQYVTLAFERVLNRQPSVAEVTECVAFLQQQTNQFSNAASLSAFPGTVETPVKPSTDAAQRARENLIHVLFNHHEFVTVR